MPVTARPSGLCNGLSITVRPNQAGLERLQSETHVAALREPQLSLFPQKPGIWVKIPDTIQPGANPLKLAHICAVRPLGQGLPQREERRANYLDFICQIA